ncbi:class I SAM-dependent methyltransferase [Micromonospora sp. SH-82]|uniref:class I SAM-dependent methyltransferase n=1 Tax=Micromonospora sp. SH-82 TaxID=3132938 RepID=UPI003EBF4E61
MTPYVLDARAWQESWDRQQEAFMPDREHRLDALLDAVEAVVDSPTPQLLDLAGGTGSISLRALDRFPEARPTLVDLDPVLLTIAEASLADRATIVTADLRNPDWADNLPQTGYDAVCTATALHWLPADRLTTLYAEIRAVLRPGGIFVNVDRMPDDGLPGLTERLTGQARDRRNARYRAGAVLSWDDWWKQVETDPTLAPQAEKRRQIYPGDHSQEWLPPVSWHLDALRTAGFSEVGTVWRGGADAAVAALR